jgi:3-keto-5-aminohexanoate cleavage enzyme
LEGRYALIGPLDPRPVAASGSPDRPVDSDLTWDYLNPGQYRRRLATGMPPLLISCATTGGHQKTENPGVPVTAGEQAETAPQVAAAGAQIIHIHGRDPDDPTRETDRAERYLEINARIRAQEPDIIIDNTQAVAPIESTDDELGGTVYRYESLPLEARPEIMALNPGPMTFRGNESSPSVVLATTFDHTERAAHALRERGIKPQVFLYHPGHLDLLEYLIVRDALDEPYFVQLVFGQQSGIGTSPDNVLSMVRNLPPGCIFQTCALGLEAIQVNTLAILLGGHVRTGMEDCIDYQRDEPALDNAQLVRRVARIAQDLGRRVATIPEARQMLGLGAPSQYRSST